MRSEIFSSHKEFFLFVVKTPPSPAVIIFDGCNEKIETSPYLQFPTLYFLFLKNNFLVHDMHLRSNRFIFFFNFTATLNIFCCST